MYAPEIKAEPHIVLLIAVAYKVRERNSLVDRVARRCLAQTREASNRQARNTIEDPRLSPNHRLRNRDPRPRQRIARSIRKIVLLLSVRPIPVDRSIIRQSSIPDCVTGRYPVPSGFASSSERKEDIPKITSCVRIASIEINVLPQCLRSICRLPPPTTATPPAKRIR